VSDTNLRVSVGRLVQECCCDLKVLWSDRREIIKIYITARTAKSTAGICPSEWEQDRYCSAHPNDEPEWLTVVTYSLGNTERDSIRLPAKQRSHVASLC
jgi:hypothetical protein